MSSTNLWRSCYLTGGSNKGAKIITNLIDRVEVHFRRRNLFKKLRKFRLARSRHWKIEALKRQFVDRSKATRTACYVYPKWKTTLFEMVLFWLVRVLFCYYVLLKNRSKRYLLCIKIVRNGSSGKADFVFRLVNGIMYTFFLYCTVLFRKININPLLLLFCIL